MNTAYSSTRSFRAAAVGYSPKVFSCDDSSGWTPRPFAAELRTAATHPPERPAPPTNHANSARLRSPRGMVEHLARSAVCPGALIEVPCCSSCFVSRHPTRYVTRALDPGGTRPVACATNLTEDSRPVRADFLAGVCHLG